MRNLTIYNEPYNLIQVVSSTSNSSIITTVKESNHASGSYIQIFSMNDFYHPPNTPFDEPIFQPPSAPYLTSQYMRFMSDGSIVGNGSDFVGTFNITGDWKDNSISFSKIYLLGTGNANDNKGHVVCIRMVENYWNEDWSYIGRFRLTNYLNGNLNIANGTMVLYKQDTPNDID